MQNQHDDGAEPATTRASSPLLGGKAALQGSERPPATSQASMTLSGTGSCTGWMETSADDGTTWEQATPTSSLTLSNPRVESAFSPGVADGTGEFARACVQNGTQAKVCTAAW
jgi:hypothetical protein